MMFTVKLSRAVCAFACACCLIPSTFAQHSSVNGLNGGFVGSDTWFRQVSTSPQAAAACHAAYRNRVAAALKSGKYTEIALVIVFPQGNPFPKKTLPDLCILSAKGEDLGVSPYAAITTDDGAVFYLVLQKGAKYKLAWKYYFGGSEDFGWLNVDRKVGGRSFGAISFEVKTEASMSASLSWATWFRHTAQGWMPPVSDNDFKRPQSDGSWRPPVSDGGYKPPRSGGK